MATSCTAVRAPPGIAQRGQQKHWRHAGDRRTPHGDGWRASDGETHAGAGECARGRGRLSLERRAGSTGEPNQREVMNAAPRGTAEFMSSRFQAGGRLVRSGRGTSADRLVLAGGAAGADLPPCSSCVELKSSNWSSHRALTVQGSLSGAGSGSSVGASRPSAPHPHALPRSTTIYWPPPTVHATPGPALIVHLPPPRFRPVLLHTEACNEMKELSSKAGAGALQPGAGRRRVARQRAARKVLERHGGTTTVVVQLGPAESGAAARGEQAPPRGLREARCAAAAKGACGCRRRPHSRRCGRRTADVNYRIWVGSCL